MQENKPQAITLYPTSTIKINIYISDMEKWEFLEDDEVYIYQLFDTISEYLIAYNRVHYKLQSIKIDYDKCNIYLIEF